MKLDSSDASTSLLFSEDQIEKLKKILTELAETYKVSDKSKKQQILTLFAGTFSTTELQGFGFNVFRRQLDNATQLKEKKGIFATPAPKSGKPVTPKSGKNLSEEVRQRVIDSYSTEDSGNVRFLPGKKDVVSMGNGQHEQKRLLLCNLKELY